MINDDLKLVRSPQVIVPADNSKGNMATTYKPVLVTKKFTAPAAPSPTTFHPKAAPAKLTEPKTPRLPSTTATTTTTSTSTTSKPASPSYFAERPFQPIITPPMRPNVKDLLATIGLTAEVMPPPAPQPPPAELTPEMRDLLNSFGLLTNEAPPKHLQFSTETETEPQDEFVPIPSYNFKLDDTFHVDEPAPIQTDFEEYSTPEYRMNTAPDMSAGDFYAFKPLPLPDEEVYPSDMESFFKSVGLLDGTYRNKKSMLELPQQLSTTTQGPTRIAMMEQIPEVRVDFLSPEMMSVLGNLGISNGAAVRRMDSPPASTVQRSDADLVKSTVSPKATELPVPVATRRSDPVSPKAPEMPAPVTTRRSDPVSPKAPKLPAPVATRRSDPDTYLFTEIPIQLPVYKPSEAAEKVFVVGTTTATKTEKPVTIILPTKINDMMDQAINAKPQSVISKINEQPKDEIAADFEKLQHLLETIKRLEKINGTLTNEDLDSIDLSRYNLSKTLLDKQGPDPIRESELDFTKNEVKRQSAENASESPFRFTLDLAATTEEGFLDKDIGDSKTTALDSSPTTASEPSSTTETADPTDSDDSSSSTTSTTSTTTTTTTTPKPTLLLGEERKNGLEDSFGGSGLDPVKEEPLPPPRRNGFYFFSDWNSFLEVGEDPDKVVVRFDPKIGDSSRFIPVEIPSKSFR